MFVQNHHSLEELQRLTKALTKKRIWLRHQAVVLAKQGHSARDRPGLGMSLAAPFRPGSTATTRGAWRPSRSSPAPDARPAWPRRMCGDSVTASRPGPPPRIASTPSAPRLAPHPGGEIRRELAPAGGL